MTAARGGGGCEMKCAHAHKSFARKKGRYIQMLSACYHILYQFRRIIAQDFFLLSQCKGRESGWNSYRRTVRTCIWTCNCTNFQQSRLEKKVGYREPFNRVILFSIRAADIFATFHTCSIFVPKTETFTATKQSVQSWPLKHAQQ